MDAMAANLKETEPKVSIDDKEAMNIKMADDSNVKKSKGLLLDNNANQNNSPIIMTPNMIADEKARQLKEARENSL